MPYLLGIDLGTSGAKTVLFNTAGEAIAAETLEYPLRQPENGWAEQEPEDWWRAVRDGIRAVLSLSGVAARDIKALGISGQMHGLVLLDEAGRVLRPAILWCDGRTPAQCDEITERVGAQRLIEITANPALPGFTAGKILWVREHEPEIWRQTAHILLPKDYVRYRLTGVLASEISDASGTNLLDVPKRVWSQEILAKLSLDPALLPPLCESSGAVGTVMGKAATETGLAKGTIAAGGAGDNAAAAVGTGVVRAGKAFTTLGTSGVVFAHSDTAQINQAGCVHTFCSAVPGAYAVMSCTLAAGLSLKWFRDTFCGEECAAARAMGVDPYYLLDQEAAQVPIGANRLLYLPYLMGERSPLLDAGARGVFFGLSARHLKRDLLRAVLEGVVYSQRQNLDILREMQVVPAEMLACGGGGTSPLWRQMLADVFDMPVRTVANREGPALGAAILAGVAAEIYPAVPYACDALIRENPPQLPLAENRRQYERFYALYTDLYPALKNSFAKLIKS